jgi:hypothetical protein
LPAFLSGAQQREIEKNPRSRMVEKANNRKSFDSASEDTLHRTARKDRNRISDKYIR